MSSESLGGPLSPSHQEGVQTQGAQPQGVQQKSGQSGLGSKVQDAVSSVTPGTTSSSLKPNIINKGGTFKPPNHRDVDEAILLCGRRPTEGALKLMQLVGLTGREKRGDAKLKEVEKIINKLLEAFIDSVPSPSDSKTSIQNRYFGEAMISLFNDDKFGKTIDVAYSQGDREFILGQMNKALTSKEKARMVWFH